jgi:putative transposase
MAQSLSDAAFGKLKVLLVNKVKANGGRLIEVGRFYPSSKTCSSCHSKKGELSLSERVFRCESCGLEIDRDENAALNILEEGLRIALCNSLSGTGLDGH